MNPSAPSPDSHLIVEGSDPASAHYSDAHGSYEPKPNDLYPELDIELGSYEPDVGTSLAIDQHASAPDTDDPSRVQDADPPAEPSIALDPTRETYNDLQRAFDFFNAQLFEGRLTPCLITVRANGRKGGYFSPNRFAHPDGRLTHEIALNIELYASQTIEYCLSILVHEMAHLAQHQDGTASRRRYHNRAFADLMGSIGLPTSNTGRPGGASVGEQMTHYIQGGGRFIVACRSLVDDGFRARWADRFFRHRRVEWIEDPSSPTPPVTQDGLDDPQATQPGASGVVPSEPGAAGDGEPLLAPPPPAPRHAGGEPSLINQNPALFQRTVDAKRSAQSKTKFQCACCLAAAWGKPSLKIMCMTCGAQMLAEEPTTGIETPAEPA